MKLFLLQVTIILILFTSCGRSKEQPKELLLYCGVTMVKPMMEIAAMIEKEENCKIHIIKGGSGDLYESIRTNKQGDLYLPGSDFYVLQGIKEEIVADTVFVGENRAVIMLKKGLGKKVEQDSLCVFRDKNIRIVIANPYSSSIGRESKRILKKKGVYDEIAARISFFGTDSDDLFLAIKDNKADVVINWHSPYAWDDNKDFVDIIEIDSLYRSEKKLTLSLLTYSKHPKIARKVLEFAHSNKGKKIFTKYGF